jgi:mRNA-degrading endonuclease HigB of HigAB toxin-antitoxin module
VDIVRTFKGNLLGGNRVIVDLGGNGSNAFRMICTFIFRKKEVLLYVNWIGTHEAYNALSLDDKMTIEIKLRSYY